MKTCNGCFVDENNCDFDWVEIEPTEYGEKRYLCQYCENERKLQAYESLAGEYLSCLEHQGRMLEPFEYCELGAENCHKCSVMERITKMERYV